MIHRHPGSEAPPEAWPEAVAEPDPGSDPSRPPALSTRLRAALRPLWHRLRPAGLAVRLLADGLGDARGFLRWSHDGRADRLAGQRESALIKAMHGIEKGLSLPAPRPGFGQDKVRRLMALVEAHLDRAPAAGLSPFVGATLATLEAWRRFNAGHGLHLAWLDRWLPVAQARLAAAQARLAAASGGRPAGSELMGGTRRLTRAEVQAAVAGTGPAFFHSRHSLRQFGPARIPEADVAAAVALAQRAPSACNRQGLRVHVYPDAAEALRHQPGNAGFGPLASHALVVTADLQAFSGAAERHQPYVDGGIFAMALVHALHALGHGSCMLAWNATPAREAQVRRALAIPPSEVIVVMIAAGTLPEAFDVAVSGRRPLGTVLIRHPPAPAEAPPLRVCLLMHSTRSDNLGVGALTVAEIALLRRVAARAGRRLAVTVVDWKDARAPYVTGEEIRIVDLDRAFLTRPSGLWALLGRSDLVIDIGAGDSFADIYGGGRLGRLLFMRGLAHLRGRPVVIAPQTIGPFRHRLWRGLARLSLARSALVATRDALSTEALRALGHRGPVVEASDLALRLPAGEGIALGEEGSAREASAPVGPAPSGSDAPPVPAGASGVAPARALAQTPRVGLNISGLLMAGGYGGANDFGLSLDYPALMRGLARALLQRGAVVELVAHVIVASGRRQGEDDLAACRALAAEVPGLRVAPAFASPSQAKAHIAGYDFFVGARMHACIAAFSSGVAVVPLAYSRKFEGLFGTLGYGRTLDCRATGTAEAEARLLQAYEDRATLRAEGAVALARGLVRLDRYEEALLDLVRGLGAGHRGAQPQAAATGGAGSGTGAGRASQAVPRAPALPAVQAAGQEGGADLPPGRAPRVGAEPAVLPADPPKGSADPAPSVPEAAGAHGG